MLLSVLGFFLKAKGESGNQFNIGHGVEISSLFNWIKNERGREKRIKLVFI
jgi:hypothetical protein